MINITVRVLEVAPKTTRMESIGRVQKISLCFRSYTAKYTICLTVYLLNSKLVLTFHVDCTEYIRLMLQDIGLRTAGVVEGEVYMKFWEWGFTGIRGSRAKVGVWGFGFIGGFRYIVRLMVFT